MGRAGVKRGELWTVAGGRYASKPRPAVILQEDVFDATESVTVALLTSTLVDVPLLRIPIGPSATTGMHAESHVVIDTITTVARSSVQLRVGRLTATQLVQVERAVATFLGLAS